MTFSGLTNHIRVSEQSSSRNGCDIKYVLLHGQASTNNEATVDAMVSGSKEVSANYTIDNEGNIFGIVPEERRAWTSGSSSDGGKGAQFDRESITIEIENSTGAPDWKFSAAAEESAARLIADIHKRHPNVVLIRINGVIGHRELWTLYRASYPTACPQSLNMDGINNRARELDGEGSAPAAVITTPASVIIDDSAVDYHFGLTKAAMLAVQQGLARLGRYKGDQDGDFGKQSVTAFQTWLKDNHYLEAGYVVDGVPGEVYGLAVQTLATKYGYTGDMDGRPGDDTSAAIAKWAATLGKTVPQIHAGPSGRDWSYWEPTGDLAKRVQRALKKMGRYNGLIDGKFGDLTRKGVQETLNISGRFVGKVDGLIERGGCYGIQQYAHDFGSYDGPIDGAPREDSWAGFALGLERG